MDNANLSEIPAPGSLAEPGLVPLVADTNFFMEFDSLKNLKWNALLPGAEAIRLIILPKVGEEIDAFKRSSGRLRRRAMEMTALAREMESSPDERTIIREESPRVTMEFAPIFRRSELDQNAFDLDDDDGRIVAEAHRLAAALPDLIFMTDDSKPLRLARNAGLRAIRPLEAWRRKEPPDERDKLIRSLQAQVGAAPKIIVSGNREFLDEGEFAFHLGPVATMSESAAQRLGKLVEQANPRISDERLIRHYGLSEGSFHLGDHQLSPYQLHEYGADHTRFLEAVREWAEKLPQAMSATNFCLPVAIQISNDGTAVAKNVVVKLSLEGRLEFSSRTLPRAFFELSQNLPDPPRPRLSFLPSYMPSMPEPPDPYLFHLATDFEKGSATSLEFRCEQLRHHDSHTVHATVVPIGSEPVTGCLRVDVLAENTVEPETLKVPIRISRAPTELGLARIARLERYFPDVIAEHVRDWLEGTEVAQGDKMSEGAQG